ncbi:unnamed protein product, partial [marine sediment metagenome]
SMVRYRRGNELISEVEKTGEGALQICQINIYF